jgi:hypothetical protein
LTTAVRDANIDSGIIGSAAIYFSWKINRMRPTAPIIIGARVRAESHGYITPPHVTGIRKDVELPTKRKIPM